MSDQLKELIELAKRVSMTTDEREQQRRSFAYGNTNIENPLVTRATVEQAAMSLDLDRKRTP